MPLRTPKRMAPHPQVPGPAPRPGRAVCRACDQNAARRPHLAPSQRHRARFTQGSAAPTRSPLRMNVRAAGLERASSMHPSSSRSRLAMGSTPTCARPRRAGSLGGRGAPHHARSVSTDALVATRNDANPSRSVTPAPGSAFARRARASTSSAEAPSEMRSGTAKTSASTEFGGRAATAAKNSRREEDDIFTARARVADRVGSGCMAPETVGRCCWTPSPHRCQWFAQRRRVRLACQCQPDHQSGGRCHFGTCQRV